MSARRDVVGDIVGVVLAGGRSRRMGRDKTRLELDGETLAARAARKLLDITPDVAVADRGRGLVAGRPSLADGPGKGPAAGILGAAAAYPGRDLLVLACDLPAVPPALLRRLAAPFDGDLLLPRWRRGVEPLVARYRPAALAVLAAEVAAGRYALHRLPAAAGVAARYLEAAALAVFGAPENVFRNLNRPEDLDAARRLAGRRPARVDFREEIGSASDQPALGAPARGIKKQENSMGTAKLYLDGKEHEFPTVVGSEGEVGIDISKLRPRTGVITLDSGYGNTGSCESAITYIDGERGILRYRGYPIEQIAERGTFPEVCYLLIYGKLPDAEELKKFNQSLTYHSMLHEDMKKFFEGFPPTAHPMAILSAMVASLSTYYPHANRDDRIDLNIIRLLAKASTIAAFSFKKSIGQPFIYPRNDLSYTENFLHMMFAVPAEPYQVNPVVERALNLLLILHADHEQNCSTSTVRMVGSSEANLYASIAAGICALWGPLHGGANQKVIEMLRMIHEDGDDYQKYVDLAKDKSADFRLMGFGHRVYKNFDPRAKILKKAADDVLDNLGVDDPLLDIARNLERIALQDEYFVKRRLYPNVDFYSGIIYSAMGIPINMFTVMFALGRLPGWIAQWKEMREDPKTRINRPRQIYVGETERPYVPIDER